MTGMSEEWGKDISRILTLSQQSADSLDARFVELAMQNERGHERLHERIEGMTSQQVVLIRSMEAMEAQMQDLFKEEKDSVPDTLSLPSLHPLKLYDEEQEDGSPSRPVVRDSVTSPAGQNPQKGSMPAISPLKAPLVLHAQGAEPEFSLYSWAAPATCMVPHMGIEDTHPEAAGTSGGGGTGSAAVSVGVGQMKLDAPPRYGGGRRPGVRV